MKKKMARLLSFVLAFLMVFTTFINDYTVMNAYAVEAEGDTDLEAITETDVAPFTVKKEPIPVTTDSDEVAPVEGAGIVAETQDNAETVAETEMNGESISEKNAEINQETVVASTENPNAEETKAETEVETETETEAETEIETEIEMKNVVISYQATDGGTVSTTSETIELSEENATLSGATALPINEYFEFVNWTDASGNEVSITPNFVPSMVTSDATYTAHFKAVSVMPAASYGPFVLQNGLSVSATVEEGVFPTGTRMKASSISDDRAIKAAQGTTEETVVAAKGADITFYDVNGKEIQPANNTKVHVTLTCNDVVEGKEHAVVHVEDNGNAEKVADATATGASFDAESFSVYAIIGTENGIGRTTYEFYNGENLWDTQIVKKGDSLVEPKIPTSLNSNIKFLGWFENGKDVAKTLPLIISDDLTEDTTVKLYARFANEYHVYFHDQNNNVVTTITANSVETVSTTKNDVTIPVEADMALVGWTATKNSEKTVDSVSISNDTDKDGIINLYPVIKAAHWLSFDSNGGSYIAPQYVLSGNKTTKPVDPTRTGYTFKGWYSNKNFTGGSKYDFNKELNANIILYAKWEGNKDISYKVVYWKEVLNDDGSYNTAGKYAYAETDTKTAKAGTTVDTNSNKIVDKKKKYNYYKFDSYDTGKTINGDGSTIINVYYKLIPYTFKFDLRDNDYYDYYRSSTISIGDYVGKNYEFTARLGENIAAKWPTEESIITSSNGYFETVFNYWKADNDNTPYGSKRFNVTKEMISDSSQTATTTYYAYYGEESQVWLHYFLENAEDSLYSENMMYSQSARSDSGYEAKQIDGFSVLTYTPWGYEDSYGNTYNFYYSRNKYNLSFYNYNAMDKEYKKESGMFGSDNSIKWGASISSLNYIPKRPSGLSQDYSFQGWYTTQDGLENSEFSFENAKMPQHNLILYAKWVLPTYTVSFDTKGADTIADKVVNKNAKVDRPADPEKAGFTFMGWYIDETCTTPFHFETGITCNYELHARWVSNTTLTILYNAGEGSAAPRDEKIYREGASVKVLGTCTAPTGKYFIGWRLGTKTYYPRDYFTLAGNMANDGVVTLMAVYESAPAKTQLTYEPNGAVGNSYSTDLVANNSSIKLLSVTAKELGYSRLGYSFNGWNTKTDKSGTHYDAEQTVAIDNLTSNVLFAEWDKIYYTVTYKPGNHGTFSEQKYNNLEYNVGTPVFNGNITGEAGYYFTGWSPAVAEKVTKNVEYVAQWAKKKAITVTAAKTTHEYDGTLFKDETATVTKGTLDEGDKISYTVTGSIRNVGETTNTISNVKIIHNGKMDVTSHYTITPENGWLKVTATSITIKANDNEKNYDGTALTAEKEDVSGNKYSYTITSGKLMGKDKIGHIDVSGEIVTPGTATALIDEKTLTIINEDQNQTSVKSNYKITLEPGTLTVKKVSKDIIVTASSDSKTYDGMPLAKNSYDQAVQSKLFSGDRLVVSISGSITNVSENKEGNNVITDVKVYHGAIDVTNCYNIQKVNGTLTINPIDITLTANSYKGPYTGDTYFAEVIDGKQYSFTDGSLLSGNAVTAIEVKGSRKEIGTTDTIITKGSVKICDTEKKDVTSNYNITLGNGMINIGAPEARTITLKAFGNEKTYDGLPLAAGIDEKTNKQYKMTGTLFNNDTIDVTVSGNQTTAGTGKSNISYVIKRDGKELKDISQYYIVKIEQGDLVVNQKPLFIRAGSAATEYGTTASSANWSFDKDENGIMTELASGDLVDVITVSGQQILPGSSDNTITGVKIKNSKGDNVTDSYAIMKLPGTLTVGKNTKNVITLTAKTMSWPYDGKTHSLTNEDFTYTGSLLSGDQITAVISGSVTNYSETKTPSVIDSYIIEHVETVNGKEVRTNVTDYYTLKPSVNGELSIDRISIALTAADAEKDFDGTAITTEAMKSLLNQDGYSYDKSLLVSGQKLTATIDIDAISSGEGKTYVKDAVITTKDGTDVTSNYIPDYVEGKAKITNEKPIAITLTASSAEKSYNATEQSVTGYKKETEKKGINLEDYNFTGISAGASGTEVVRNADDSVGAYPSTFTGTLKITDKTGNDVTKYFAPEYKLGKLTILPVEVTISAKTTSRSYNGEALQGDYTAGNIVAGQRITNVNYLVNKKIAAPTITLPGSLTYIPTDARILSGETENADDVTKNYIIKYTEGSLTITTDSAKPIIVKAASTKHTYDGNAFSYNYYEPLPENTLYPGDEIVVTVEGSATNVGDPGENKVTDVQIFHGTTHDKANNVTQCYTVSTNKGKLTIDARRITLKANGNVQTFTGKTYKAAADSAGKLYTVIAGEFVKNDLISAISVLGERAAIGQTPTEIQDGSVIIIDSDNNADVTHNYAIIRENGEIVINPPTVNSITLTANGNNKTYDGTPLEAKVENGKQYFVTGSLFEGDTITATVEGSQTTAATGSSKITGYSITSKNLSQEEISKYYNVKYTGDGTTGKLEVVKRPLTLTAADANKNFDGTVITTQAMMREENNNKGYLITDGTLAANQRIENADISIDEIYSESGKTYVKNAVIVDNSITEGSNVVTGNYDIAYKDGTASITNTNKIPITFTAKSDTNKVYSGKKQSVSGFTASAGNFSLAGYTFENITAGAEATNVKYVGNSVAAYDAVFAGTTELVIKDAAGKDVTQYFAPGYQNGELKINPAKLTITAKTDTRSYNGDALLGGYDATDTVNGQIIEGVTYLSNGNAVTPKITLPGDTLTYIPTGARVMAGTENVTGNYDIKYVEGTISVTNENKNSIEVTSGSTSQTYNGSALTMDSSEITDGELFTGDEIVVEITGSATNVADTKANNNTISSVKVYHGDIHDAAHDVTDCYTIKTVNGTLTVNPIAITLTANGNTPTFTGDTFYAEVKNGKQYEITSGQLLDSNTISGGVKVNGSCAEVGVETETTIDRNSVKITNKAGDTVTGNYDITLVPGKILISAPAAKMITLRANGNDEKTYDGTPLYAKTVNGKQYSVEESLFIGDTIGDVVVEGSQTTCGIGTSRIASYKIYRNNKELTKEEEAKYYKVKLEDGALPVAQRNITIKTEGQTTKYGTAAVNGSWSLSNGSLAPTDEITVEITGKQIAVGESNNTLGTVTITDKDGNDVKGSYVVTPDLGKLKVEKNTDAIVITANDGSWLYNGEYHSLTSGDFTYSGTLYNGDELTVTMEGRIKNYSQVPVASHIKNWKVTNTTGDDVTDYYTFGEPTDGKLSITKRPLTLKANDNRGKYTGEYLYAEEIEGKQYSVTPATDTTGLVGKDTIYKAPVTGSQLYPGTGHSEITKADVVIRDTILGIIPITEVTENYDIICNSGNLVVDEPDTKEITVTANGNTKVYDGKPISPKVTDNMLYTSSGSELHTGDYLVVEVEGSRTEAGGTDGKESHIKSVAVKHDTISIDGEKVVTDVTGFYKINEIDSDLVVTPKALKITASKLEKVYDGKPVTKEDIAAPGYSIDSVDNLAEGQSVESIEITVDDNLTVSREKAVHVDNVTITDGTNRIDNKNYSIVYVDGNVEVSNEEQLSITLTANSGTYTYTGSAFVVNGFTASTDSNIDIQNFIFQFVEAGATATAIGNYPVSFTFDIPEEEKESDNQIRIWDEFENDVTSYFQVNYVKGLLIINPVPAAPAEGGTTTTTTAAVLGATREILPEATPTSEEPAVLGATRTSDENNLFIWLVGLGLSVSTLFGYFFMKKKENEEQE